MVRCSTSRVSAKPTRCMHDEESHEIPIRSGVQPGRSLSPVQLNFAIQGTMSNKAACYPSFQLVLAVYLKSLICRLCCGAPQFPTLCTAPLRSKHCATTVCLWISSVKTKTSPILVDTNHFLHSDLPSCHSRESIVRNMDWLLLLLMLVGIPLLHTEH